MATGRSTRQSEVAHRHTLFASAYAEHGDATAAAIAAGFSTKRADVQGARLMSDVRVGPRARALRDARIKAQQDDFCRQQTALRFAADGAISTLADVAMRAPRDDDGKVDRLHHLGAIARVQAAIAILDRAGHKPVERVEQSVTWEDIGRELVGIDTAGVLREALASIAESPAAQAAAPGE